MYGMKMDRRKKSINTDTSGLHGMKTDKKRMNGLIRIENWLDLLHGMKMDRK